MSETEKQSGGEVISISPDYEQYVEDGKNKFALKCPRCGSKILEKQSGRYVLLEQDLPHSEVSMDKTAEVSKEVVKDYYLVENMFTFENIGFTYQVEDLKYLSCADCEAGPLGVFNIGSKHSYLALSRVTHVQNE